MIKMVLQPLRQSVQDRNPQLLLVRMKYKIKDENADEDAIADSDKDDGINSDSNQEK